MLIQLTEERKGQIALAIFRQAVAGVSSDPPMNESKATELIEDIKETYGEIPIEFDIGFGEILSFFREFVRDEDKYIFDKITYNYTGPATVPV